jgi:hypothetical protein
MKKLLLTLLSIASLSAFAQKDASIRLLLPESDQEINSGKPFQVAFSITNVGMDTILTSDSFAVVPVVITTGGITPLSGLRGAAKIAPGDSVLLSAPNGYVLNFTTDILDAGFCVSMFFNDSTVDLNDSNDTYCSAVVLKVFTTGVSEANALASSVKAFPNPANSYFTLTMNASDATVEVLDITGKLIETAALTMGEARLDVSNYKNGVYFYHIKDAANSVVKSGKFTVSH